MLDLRRLRIYAALAEQEHAAGNEVLATVAITGHAADDLRRAVEEDGLAGLILSTNPPGSADLADPVLEGLWEAAAGLGVPVVLHPLALSGQAWGGYAGRLASSFEVITPDARGHGNSGWDGQPFGLTDLGDDVAALLDGLGIASAFVTGMSMGGSTAVNFAGRYPARADGLVLADTTAWYGDNAAATWAARAEGVVATPREQQVTFQADRWFTEEFRQRNPDEVSRVVGIFLRTDSRAHAAACRALGTMDSRDLLPGITAPTLVITGEEDYATPPAMGQAIADGVARGSAQVLPSLRHLSLVEAPGLARLTAEFLTAAGTRG